MLIFRVVVRVERSACGTLIPSAKLFTLYLDKHISGWLGQRASFNKRTYDIARSFRGYRKMIIPRRRYCMNPVIGLDVSKGESQIQAFLDKGKPYRKSFSIKQNTEGFR